MVTIKEARRKLGLTQKQMAYLIGMATSGVGRIEAGYEGRSETRQIQHYLVALLVLHRHGLVSELASEIEAIQRGKIWNNRNM